MEKISKSIFEKFLLYSRNGHKAIKSVFTRSFSIKETSLKIIQTLASWRRPKKRWVFFHFFKYWSDWDEAFYSFNFFFLFWTQLFQLSPPPFRKLKLVTLQREDDFMFVSYHFLDSKSNLSLKLRVHLVLSIKYISTRTLDKREDKAFSFRKMSHILHFWAPLSLENVWSYIISKESSGPFPRRHFCIQGDEDHS